MKGYLNNLGGIVEKFADELGVNLEEEHLCKYDAKLKKNSLNLKNCRNLKQELVEGVLKIKTDDKKILGFINKVREYNIDSILAGIEKNSISAV